MSLTDIKEMKDLLPYVTQAQSFEEVNPMFSYYLMKYSTEKGYKVYQKLKAEDPAKAKLVYDQISQWMAKTEQLSQSTGQHDLKSNYNEILQYTDKIFLLADNQYRAGAYTPEVTQNFQTAWRLYDVLGHFEQLSDDQQKRKKYAKAKTIEVYKKLKQGGATIPQQQPQQPVASQGFAPNYTPLGQDAGFNFPQNLPQNNQNNPYSAGGYPQVSNIAGNGNATSNLYPGLGDPFASNLPQNKPQQSPNQGFNFPTPQGPAAIPSTQGPSGPASPAQWGATPTNNQPNYIQPQPSYSQPQPSYNQPAAQQTPQGGGGNKKKVDPERVAAQGQAINQLQNAISELSFSRFSHAKDAIQAALRAIQRFD